MVAENTLLERITVNPRMFGGKPIIRGRRLAVEHVLGMLAANYCTIIDAAKVIETIEAMKESLRERIALHSKRYGRCDMREIAASEALTSALRVIEGLKKPGWKVGER